MTNAIIVASSVEVKWQTSVSLLNSCVWSSEVYAVSYLFLRVFFLNLGSIVWFYLTEIERLVRLYCFGWSMDQGVGRQPVGTHKRFLKTLSVCAVPGFLNRVPITPGSPGKWACHGKSWKLKF